MCRVVDGWKLSTFESLRKCLGPPSGLRFLHRNTCLCSLATSIEKPKLTWIDNLRLKYPKNRWSSTMPRAKRLTFTLGLETCQSNIVHLDPRSITVIVISLLILAFLFIKMVTSFVYEEIFASLRWILSNNIRMKWNINVAHASGYGIFFIFSFPAKQRFCRHSGAWLQLAN